MHYYLHFLSFTYYKHVVKTREIFNIWTRSCPYGRLQAATRESNIPIIILTPIRSSFILEHKYCHIVWL
uniref:Uncharacterized protein n=1 Tax=Arundo donax TaxID=35708 RepID=A0A0A8Y496_ARUDO